MMNKVDDPAYNFSSDGIIAGCDTCLVEDNGNVFLDTSDGKAIKVGAAGVTKKHRTKKSKTMVGDIIFGCCADVVIRDGVVLYPEEAWFFGKNLHTPFTYKEEQPINLVKDILENMPENCRHEFLVIEDPTHPKESHTKSIGEH